MSSGLNVSGGNNSSSKNSTATSMETLQRTIESFTAKNHEGNNASGADAKQKADNISSEFSNINGAISSAWSDIGTGVNAVYVKLSDELSALESCLKEYAEEIKREEERARDIAASAHDETDDFINTLNNLI